MLRKKIVSLTLFKNITVSRPSTLFRSFLMGRSGFTTIGTRGGGGLPLLAQKFELPSSAGYHPTQKIESLSPSPHHRSHIGEKVFLIAFKLILQKFLPAVHIFSHNHEKFVGTKPFNTKQCQAGLSSTIIPPAFPFLPKMAKNDTSFDTALLSTPATRNNFTSSPKGEWPNGLRHCN